MRGPRTWTKPELLVLVRSREEEMVLGSCKDAAHEHADIGTSNMGCLGVLRWPCVLCSTIMHS